MPAYPDLAAYFFEMEKLVEAQPDSVIAEIARGAYAMSPRPRPRHGALQARLCGRSPSLSFLPPSSEGVVPVEDYVDRRRGRKE